MKRAGIFLVLVSLTGCEFLPDFIGIGSTPGISSVSPGSGDANVSVGAVVNAALNLPNGGVDQTSVGEQGVRLVDAATGTVVEANVSVDNDAETLTLEPVNELEFSSTYTFTVTPSLIDVSGKSFKDHSNTFTTVSSDLPSVTGVRPADGARGVATDVGIGTDLNGSVDKSTVSPETVYLVEAGSGERVQGLPGSTGAGDNVTFQPYEALNTNTTYQFNVTSGVIDTNGQAFVPFTSIFTTGGASSGCTDNCNIVVEPQLAAADERHSSLAFGPDGNLYATTITGQIKRYPVGSDGTLGNPETLTSLTDANGGPRLTVGLTFDPGSTEDNLIVWVTHTEIGPFIDGAVRPGIDAPWAGKLTRLSGPDLETVQDFVIGLPRSNKDHVTNSVAFNPAEPGVVYFVQGSNTAMGAPDRTWGYQEERTLSGAVLRLDTTLLSSFPLNARTEDGGTYDPFEEGAPLTVYASGTRNSYDLVWHTSGNLYVPANGSNRGGVVPRYDPLPGTCESRIDGKPYTGPVLGSPGDVAGTYTDERTDGWVISETQQDYLFKIDKGGYYGTPNPKRCEWILFGGGSSSLNDRVPQYPGSVQPDPNYRGFAYDFGINISPNGSLEYRGNAFPQLRGSLLITRYSTGDDVVAVSFDEAGSVVGEATSIVPSGSFGDPIDIAESPNTGFLYVSSYDELGKASGGAGIALLRPQ